jgi:hypothetical protein
MKMICSSHAGLTFFELFEKYPEPLVDLFQLYTSVCSPMCSFSVDHVRQIAVA